MTKSLNILWQGIVAILIVVGVIIIVTYLMQFVSKKIDAAKERKNSPPDDENR